MTTTDYEPNIVLETGSYNVVGTRPVRHDAINKVTGRDQFGADVQFAGLLHGRILRSPFAHARIKSIDTGKAEAIPGVKAVVTGDDLPQTDDTALKYRRATYWRRIKSSTRGRRWPPWPPSICRSRKRR